MSYRGEDLDLRTPQMGARPPADLGNGDIGAGRSRGYGLRGETIWVDDTVLACCNLAYDLAVTHRAGEVRIEHLIYALTRIDAAAETLESRGIRVAALRREMGNIVASEIPIGLPNGKGTPRRSEDLETLLREAAEIAGRRSSAAGVDDLVSVLVDTSRDLPGRDLPALAHLRRHLTTRSTIERDYEPLVRSREVRAYTPPPAYETRAWNDPVPLSATRTDAVQNSRIEALEQVVRSLGSDLASERKTMSNLLLDIQRDVGSRRDEDGRLGGGVIDRLGAVEHAIEKRLAEIGRSWNLLNDRLQMMEQALMKSRPDTAADLVALHDRLTGIERGLQGTAVDDSRHWTLIGDRLKALEATIAGRSTAGAGPELARIGERFDMIEHVLLERASEATTEASKLAARLKTIEEAQAAQKVQAMQLNAALAAEVNKLTTAISQQQLPGADQLVPALNERFKSIAGLIEQQRTEIAGAGVDRLMPMITERFQVLAAMIERQRGELAANLVQPVGERLDAIGTTLEARQGESLRAVTALVERVGAIERGMSGYVQKVTEQGAAYDEDIDQIQDALIKINTHQSATATSLEQWHHQANELGIISNRLAALERLSMRPAQMIDQLSEKIDSMHRVIAEKAEKRNRFYYWLFGTNSWLSASWPSRLKPSNVGPAVAVQRQTPPAPR